MPRTTVVIKIDETTRDRLRALASARNRPPQWIVEQALAEYLNREEVHERERVEDAARWEQYARTGESVSHERVRTWLEALAEGRDAACPR